MPARSQSSIKWIVVPLRINKNQITQKPEISRPNNAITILALNAQDDRRIIDVYIHVNDARLAEYIQLASLPTEYNGKSLRRNSLERYNRNHLTTVNPGGLKFVTSLIGMY